MMETAQTFGNSEDSVAVAGAAEPGVAPPQQDFAPPPPQPVFADGAPQHESAPPPPPPPAQSILADQPQPVVGPSKPVEEMGPGEKIVEALKRAIGSGRFTDEVKAQLLALLDPRNLAVLIAVFGMFAIMQAGGLASLAVDAIAFAMLVIFLGPIVFDLGYAIGKAMAASSDEELNAAADLMANALAQISVAALMWVFGKAAKLLGKRFLTPEEVVATAEGAGAVERGAVSEPAEPVRERPPNRPEVPATPEGHRGPRWPLVEGDVPAGQDIGPTERYEPPYDPEQRRWPVQKTIGPGEEPTVEWPAEPERGPVEKTIGPGEEGPRERSAAQGPEERPRRWLRKTIGDDTVISRDGGRTWERPRGRVWGRRGTWRQRLRRWLRVRRGIDRRHIVADQFVRRFVSQLGERELRRLGYDPATRGGLEAARRAYQQDIFNDPRNLWTGDAAENQALGRSPDERARLDYPPEDYRHPEGMERVIPPQRAHLRIDALEALRRPLRDAGRSLQSLGEEIERFGVPGEGTRRPPARRTGSRSSGTPRGAKDGTASMSGRPRGVDAWDSLVDELRRRAGVRPHSGGRRPLRRRRRVEWR